MTSVPTHRVDYGWIGEAWRLFLANAGLWIAGLMIAQVGFIAIFAVFAPFMYLAGMFTTSSNSSGDITAPQGVLLGLFYLLYALFLAYIHGGLYRMAVKQVRGLPLVFRDIWSGLPVFGPMLAFSLLYGLAFLGVEAFCGLIPGLIAAFLLPSYWGIVLFAVAIFLAVLLFLFLICVLTGLLLPAYALVGDGEGVRAAWGRSVRAMRGQWLRAAGFVFVLGLLVLVSEIVTCSIALLATLPMVWLVAALAYRDMIGMPDMAAPKPNLPAQAPPQEGVWPPPPNAGGFR